MLCRYLSSMVFLSSFHQLCDLYILCAQKIKHLRDIERVKRCHMFIFITQVSEQFGRIRRCSAGMQQAGLGPGRRLSESVVHGGKLVFEAPIFSTCVIARGNVGCGDLM